MVNLVPSSNPSVAPTASLYNPSEEYCIHKSLAERNSSALESLSWEIDFSAPIEMNSSVSPITCLDDFDCNDDESSESEEENDQDDGSKQFLVSYQRLVQRDLGVDAEMAKALCARNREKESMRPYHFCDYVGRKNHPEFNAFERSKLVDSMVS
jgi:hypothetical protein